MKTRAIQRNVHISHRKVQLVVDLIRNKKVDEATRILENTNKKSAPIIKKLLHSAIANAMNNHSMNGSSLYVYEIFANEGPTWKRTMPRAKGSADRLFKRTTHIEIVLSDDHHERQKDLQLIKEKIAKRAEGNRKHKEPAVQKPATAKNADAEKEDHAANKEKAAAKKPTQKSAKPQPQANKKGA